VKSLVHDRWEIGDAHLREEASKFPASIVEGPHHDLRSAPISVRQIVRDL
jgi:hypothetical protein